MPSKECIMTYLIFCKVAIVSVPGLQPEELKLARWSDVQKQDSLWGAGPGFKTRCVWLQSRGMVPLLHGLVLPWKSPTDPPGCVGASSNSVWRCSLARGSMLSSGGEETFLLCPSQGLKVGHLQQKTDKQEKNKLTNMCVTWEYPQMSNTEVAQNSGSEQRIVNSWENNRTQEGGFWLPKMAKLWESIYKEGNSWNKLCL